VRRPKRIEYSSRLLAARLASRITTQEKQMQANNTATSVKAEG
jgi:hypothetical protein